jgi:hypothetical protein
VREYPTGTLAVAKVSGVPTFEHVIVKIEVHTAILVLSSNQPVESLEPLQ